jgi:drug/metabolite transporter (DMT)-like permease
LPGEALAVFSAFCWALSSTLVKSQSQKISIVLMWALRTIPALAIYWGYLIFTGQCAALLELSGRSWFFLLGATLVGMVIGDLIYFESMKYIGLSRARPLSSIYPFFTILLALLFLNERITWSIVGGATLIVGGGLLLAFPRRTRSMHRGAATVRQQLDLRGVALALSAAVCWGASTILLRQGLEGVEVPVANTVRLSILGLVLWIMAAQRKELRLIGRCTHGKGLWTLGAVMLTGIVGMSLGTFAYLAAVQRAGAARTSVLASSMPLFGVPFSLLLGEKLTARTVVGTLLAIGGVWLTI